MTYKSARHTGYTFPPFEKVKSSLPQEAAELSTYSDPVCG